MLSRERVSFDCRVLKHFLLALEFEHPHSVTHEYAAPVYQIGMATSSNVHSHMYERRFEHPSIKTSQYIPKQFYGLYILRIRRCLMVLASTASGADAKT